MALMPLYWVYIVNDKDIDTASHDIQSPRNMPTFVHVRWRAWDWRRRRDVVCLYMCVNVEGLVWVHGVVCLCAREMEGLGRKQARDVVRLCMCVNVEGLVWVHGVVCLCAREMEGLGRKQVRDVVCLCMRMHVEGLGWCKRRGVICLCAREMLSNVQLKFTHRCTHTVHLRRDAKQGGTEEALEGEYEKGEDAWLQRCCQYHRRLPRHRCQRSYMNSASVQSLHVPSRTYGHQ